MAKFTITIYVEGFVTQVDGSVTDRRLGRTLTVALTEAPTGLTEEDKRTLAMLLCPWRWDSIKWKTGVASNLEGHPEEALETYVRYLLDIRESLLAAGKTDPLMFRTSVDEPDDAEETLPIWPGLLAQLGRMGPQITHPLKLAHLATVTGPGPFSLEIEQISIGDTPYLINSGGDLVVRCEPSDPVDVLPPGFTGLIHHDTRLVDQNLHEPSTAYWLAELPSRLGRAIEPLARLADLAEVSDAPTFGDPGAAIERMLLELFGGRFDYDSQGLAEIFLAIADLAPTGSLEEKRAFAGDWSLQFGTKRDALAKALAAVLSPLPPEPPDPSPRLVSAELRERYSGLVFRTLVQDALKGSVPTTSNVLQEAAQAWLANLDHVAILLHDLLPEALARRRFMPALIREVGGKSDDWQPLEEAFGHVFDGELESLGLKADEQVTQSAQRQVFHIERESVDAAARDGLPFRVDTIFHNPDADPASKQPDMHLLLDGYVVAVSDAKIDGGWNPYVLASAASLDILISVPGKEPVARAPVEGINTPLQVCFDVARGGATTETRVAATSYHGQAMIPWSAREVPGDQEDFTRERAESGPVRLEYAPRNIDYPPLAYGQTYRIVCGYQAPGGALPAFFSKDGRTFSPEALERCPSEYVLELPLRRTLSPGAPRFLAAGGHSSRPAEFAGPDDANVRPLWREHVALWPSALAASRTALRDVPTLYLDGAYPHTTAKTSCSFTIRPPTLALGKADKNATTALVWRYWRERDRQWSRNEVGQILPPTEMMEADDPAVVGNVQGSIQGLGGVCFRLYEIKADGLQEMGDVHRAVLTEGQRVDVTILATDDQFKTTYSPPNVVGVATLVILIPRDQRVLLEAWSMCDARFRDGSVDPRLDSEIPSQNLDDEVMLFGAVRVAIESLPSTNHLPAANALWQLISVEEDASTGLISASLHNPSPANTKLAHDADFIGALQPFWQTWRWDGGPVLSYEDPEAGNLEAGTLEQRGVSRTVGYEIFERRMFEDRRDGGATAIQQRSACTVARLFDLENLPNRGANYLRIRLDASSRYAALRPGAEGNQCTATANSALTNEAVRWRGYTIGVRRRDPLPTPRISLAAPLFGRIDKADSTAGGIVLYLDHPMFDPRHGGGLAEKLDVAVTVERVQFGTGNEETAALAMGVDPVGPLRDGPFESGSKAPTLLGHRDAKGHWTPGEPTTQSLRPGVILGQTLEPKSPEPQFPFSIAFIEPTIDLEPGTDSLTLRPDTMAKIEVRTVTDTLSSPWSAPLWVHFLPDMSGTVTIGTPDKPKVVQMFVATSGKDGVLLSPNVEAGKKAKACIARLQNLCGDKPGSIDGPYLLSGIMAVLVRTITDAAGKPRTRVAAVVPGTFDSDGVRFAIPHGLHVSHLRIIEVQVVSGSAGRSGDSTLNEATKRWFGEQPEPFKIDDGWQKSLDINERVVGIGPLVAVVGDIEADGSAFESL